MTLQALRAKVGDTAFFALLRQWYARNRYGNVTTADFIALAEQLTGQQLDAFFDAWLYTPGKPTSW
jgi:aminopeptidase N